MAEFDSSEFSPAAGRVVLVDFWDYTCLNCIRTLPYVQAWHELYREKGLTVIGVHTHEFTFAQYESNVERGFESSARPTRSSSTATAKSGRHLPNRYWPTKYLLGKDGYLRYGNFGEGGYGECEQVIQELLREVDSTLELPPVMAPAREEDHVGTVCYRATGELYLGHQRGRIGNEGGFKEDQIADYSFNGSLDESFFYANGRWASTGEYFEAAEEGPHSLRLKYEAAAVNLVMACPHALQAEVVILQDGGPFTERQATRDTRFRSGSADQPESYLLVDSPRMYFLVHNHEFGLHELEFRCSSGVAAFAFTFTSCVDPVASALQASGPAEA